MELSQLITYAKDKYQIKPQYRLKDFPGFPVLCHPGTKKDIAFLMQQYDSETGEFIECCDLKCSPNDNIPRNVSWISRPFHKKSPNWIGISFTQDTDADAVFHLFDQAVQMENQSGCTIVLDEISNAADKSYHDTPLPFSDSSYRPAKEVMPDRLRRLIRMFSYFRHSPNIRAKEFYEQAKFMENYTDDVPWTGSFFTYFPTYQDLTTTQLRGYFSWRTRVRNGEYTPISSSAAHIYIYELLNGIGTSSAEDALQKMKDFESGFIDSGIGDENLRPGLDEWMVSFAILHALPSDLIKDHIDKKTMQKDEALAALRSPAESRDEQIFSALCLLAPGALSNSAVISMDRTRAVHLFSEAWRSASHYIHNGMDLFTLCFGKPIEWRWLPLNNTVYYRPDSYPDADYILDPVRSYYCRHNVWKTRSYDSLYFDKDLFNGFLHETDRLLRKYLKTGRKLKQRTSEEWADPYVNVVIEADRKAVLEASRPKISIDLSELDQIRSDSLITRNSLLTEEDLQELNETQVETVPEPETKNTDEAQNTAAVPLNAVEAEILRILLCNEDPSSLIRKNHLTPALTADKINEAMFDEIGDTILVCEDDQLSIVEDYREDLARLLGGTQ